MTSMKRILKLFSIVFTNFNLLRSFITGQHKPFGERLLALNITKNVRIHVYWKSVDSVEANED